MELHQTKNLLPSKGNNQQMESQLTEQEKIFVNLLFHKGLICKIYKDFIQPKKKTKQNNLIRKLGKYLRMFFQRIYANGHEVCEKLSITSHQEMQIKVTMKYPSHLLGWLFP